MSACCHWTLLAEGAQAASEVHAHLFGPRVYGSAPLLPTQKDNRSPLTKPGFEAILRKITLELMRVTGPAEQKGLAKALQALDNNWSGLTPAQVDAAIERAARALGGVPDVVVSPVVQALAKAGTQLVTDTKREAVGKYTLPVSASFSLVDEKVVKHSAASQAFYIRDEFGKRQAAFSVTARQIVSRGLRDGLDSATIGGDLRDTLGAAGVNRSIGYWTNVASIFAARSRTYGVVSSFEEAGIEEFEVTATLDEVSCDVCRFMDGRTFSVPLAAKRFEAVAASDDPEAVKALMPFVSVGVNSEGQRALFYGTGEDRKPVARVDSSAVGELDAKGSFSHAMSRAGMEKAGIGQPPFHGRCRCLCEPA